jgi:hypothetical protein
LITTWWFISFQFAVAISTEKVVKYPLIILTTTVIQIIIIITQMDWLQDRGQWRPLVNTFLNIVSYMGD